MRVFLATCCASGTHENKAQDRVLKRWWYVMLAFLAGNGILLVPRLNPIHVAFIEGDEFLLVPKWNPAFALLINMTNERQRGLAVFFLSVFPDTKYERSGPT